MQSQCSISDTRNLLFVFVMICWPSADTSFSELVKSSLLNCEVILLLSFESFKLLSEAQNKLNVLLNWTLSCLHSLVIWRNRQDYK